MVPVEVSIRRRRDGRKSGCLSEKKETCLSKVESSSVSGDVTREMRTVRKREETDRRRCPRRMESGSGGRSRRLRSEGRREGGKKEESLTTWNGELMSRGLSPGGEREDWSDVEDGRRVEVGPKDKGLGLSRKLK